MNTRMGIYCIISFLLGGLVVGLLGQKLLQDERERLYAGAEKVQVIVAKRDLPVGTVLELDDLAIKQVYRAAVGDNVFHPEQVSTLCGKRLRFSVKKANPIIPAQVDIQTDSSTDLQL